MMQSIYEKSSNAFFLGRIHSQEMKTSDTTIEESIPAHLHDQEPTHLITCTEVFTRVLGVEWNANTDPFRPLVLANQNPGKLTKRRLLSEVAKLFDALG